MLTKVGYLLKPSHVSMDVRNGGNALDPTCYCPIDFRQIAVGCLCSFECCLGKVGCRMRLMFCFVLWLAACLAGCPF